MDEFAYYIMHKNVPVIPVIIDKVTGNIVAAGKPINSEHLPLGGRTIDTLKKWWNMRAVPKSQRNIQQLLLRMGIPSTQSLLVRNLGLSLTDHYWIQPCELGSQLKWEEVSLFDNTFDPVIRTFTMQDSKFSPASSVQGQLEKYWVIDKAGNRCLIKGNIGDTGIQSANEVIASLLHKKQGKFPYVVYKLYRRKCICMDFATKEVEFIPAYEVINAEKKANNVSDYEQFIRVCVANGLHEGYVRSFLEYQILTDFILTNIDRHYNNFGILRDSTTLRFISLAPIFDTGNSLFSNAPLYPIQHPDLQNISVNSFASTEHGLLKYVRDFSLVDITKLPTTTEISNILKQVGAVPDTIAIILKGYNRKIELLQEMQMTGKVFGYKK